MTAKQSFTRRQLFEKANRWFEIPMLVVTLVLLVVIVVQEIFTLSEFWIRVMDIVDLGIWAAFAIELISLTYLAENRLQHLKKHWLDVVIVIIPTLRFARFLRIARLARVARVSRAARITRTTRVLRIFPLFILGLQKSKAFFTRHKFHYILLICLILMLVLGALGAAFEKTNPDANITNVYEGIWWAFTSITTVGYGDRFPVTPAGRIMGVILITVGITMFSMLVANISSLLVEEDEKKAQQDLNQKLDLLEQKVNKVLSEVAKINKSNH